MKTERKFVEALKAMMEEVPLEEISVLALSKRCHVKRQTFYYHFHDIYDLLMVTFLDEVIPDIEDVTTFDDLLTTIYAYYTKNKGFLDATIDSAGKELFMEFMENAVYQALLRIINEYDSIKELTLNERKTIARYHSYGIADVLITYLSTHKNKSLPELRNQYLFLPKGFLSESVREMIKKKNR